MCIRDRHGEADGGQIAKPVAPHFLSGGESDERLGSAAELLPVVLVLRSNFVGERKAGIPIARALGLLNPENTSSQAVQALSRAARQDSFALVREASLTALVRIAHSQAQPIVREAAASDQEPAIRKLASQLVQSY